MFKDWTQMLTFQLENDIQQVWWLQFQAIAYAKCPPQTKAGKWSEIAESRLELEQLSFDTEMEGEEVALQMMQNSFFRLKLQKREKSENQLQVFRTWIFATLWKTSENHGFGYNERLYGCLHNLYAFPSVF